MRELKGNQTANRIQEAPLPEVGKWASMRWTKLHQAKEEGTQIYPLLYRLLTKVTQLILPQDGISFPTLFSALAYLKSIYHLSGKLVYLLQHFRKMVEEGQPKDELDELGLYVLHQLIQNVWPDLRTLPSYSWSPSDSDTNRTEFLRYHDMVQGVVLREGPKEHTLWYLPEREAEDEVVVYYQEADRNDIFSANIQSLLAQDNLPIAVNLWQVEIDKEGGYHPTAFIIQPDFLVDVTAVASCFSGAKTHIWSYVMRKFVPSTSSKYLLKGHIANVLLDEMLHHSRQNFRELFRATFHRFALDYLLLPETDMKEVYEDSATYFKVIQRVVEEIFPRLGIHPGHCLLEPSFYRPSFGLQGRLDVLHEDIDKQLQHIIELKSGSIFRPNKYGLAASHYVQTLLYDLLVEGSTPKERETLAYILYSRDYDRPLRNAPVVRAQQWEALQIRNRIILWEMYLTRMTGTKEDIRFFGLLQADKLPVNGFLRDNVALFQEVFVQLNVMEKVYFTAFVGFLAREHHLSKTGVEGSDRHRGLASIWRDSVRQKEEKFSILRGLKVRESRLSEEHIVILTRSKTTDALANFRKGDIVVLYPEEWSHHPERTQIFKGSLVQMDQKEVQIRLRNAQVDPERFTIGSSWCAEHDVFDSSYMRGFHNLFYWASLSPHKRAQFLGEKPPERAEESSESKTYHFPKGITKEQADILLRMWRAKDYFLLWGPPGTGKTSIMLRHYVQRILTTTSSHVLILAYTNRAVDEICDHLRTIQEEHSFNYLRIGSRYSTAKRFVPDLLQEKVSNWHTRKECHSMLLSHQVFVGTLASYMGKRELLSIVPFSEVIVDEASQLLEPMVSSLWHDFQKVILIGDHRQLPAVVQQAPGQAQLQHAELNALGIRYLGNSLFERLYQRCEAKGWYHAFDKLSMQGRMHQDIMDFSSSHFYKEQLKPLAIDGRVLTRLEAPIQWSNYPQDLSYHVAQTRMGYVPSLISEGEEWNKTNEDEAIKVVTLIQSFRRVWLAEGKPWTAESLGVITPFRAQIAQIQTKLWALDEGWTDTVTIDTVERYQGGARDIILLSVCVNTPRQWQAVLSLNEEGVDRKLNVALTRAREFFVLLGNEEILRSQPLYAQLLASCKKVSSD